MQTKICPKGKKICDCENTDLKLKKLPNVKSKIRPFKKYTPPQPRNKDLPPCYNIILSSSPKGGGKSFNCVELLTSYEESGFVSSEGNDVRMRIIWVSGGTARSKQNNILNTLKTLHDKDRIDVEDDIDDTLNEIYDSLLAERDTIEEYNEYRRVYKKFMKSNIANMTDEELQLLEWKSFINPAEDPDAPRDPIYKILKPAEKVRIRELGCLDASQAIVFEDTIAGAKKLFEEKTLPIVLQRVQGGTQKPGPSCRGCRANTMCPTLPNRPGLLGITAFAPWPKAYSPSKFHSYRRCPRQYFLQDELGLRTTQETQNNAQQRGLLVHAWLEQAHKRAQECTKEDIPTSSSLGIIATELGWNQEEANTALPFLIQHQLTCPINKDSRVVTELAIEALDTDADITVSTRPDLIYKNGDDLVWREIKTVSSIQDIEKDIYFNIYPQLPLAIRLMVQDCLPKEVTEKLGNFKNKRVELELISNDECKTISWDCDDANVKLSAWSQLAEQVDSWASDTLFAPSPNPPCNWCKVSKWCEFANAEQVQADIGGLQVDLKTGEIIENASIPLISSDDRVAKALGLSASLAEVSENDEDIPF